MDISPTICVTNACSDSATDTVSNNNDVEMKAVPLPVDDRLHTDDPDEDWNFKTKPSTSKISHSDKNSDYLNSSTDVFVNTAARKKKKVLRKKISPKKTQKPINNSFDVFDNDNNSFDKNKVRNPNGIQIPRLDSNTETEISEDDLPICYSQDLFNIDHLIISNKCPLCLKICDKIVIHVKKCAVKRKLSTKQLFDLLKLEKEHDKKREAIGLPIIPEKSEKPKRKRNTKMLTTGLGSSLDLALALSRSEMELKQQNLMEEAENLVNVGLHEEAADTLKTLEQFGFSSSSSISNDPTGRKKSKKSSLLLTRTCEEREKILTEKVAMVILDNEDKEMEIDENKFAEHSSPKSLKLRKHYDKYDGTDQLPGTTKTTDETTSLGQNDSEEPSRSGDSVSEQICGTQDSISEDLLKEPGFSRTTTEYLNTALREDDVGVPSPENPIFEELLRTETNILSYRSMKSIRTLINNWKTIFRKKCFSDITVLTEDNHEIPVHRLVLYVRCCNILKSATENRNCKIGTPYVINWKEISIKAAHIFLKYIYCGEFKDVFKQSGKIFEDLLLLIKRYKIKELDTYINEINHDEYIAKDKSINNSSVISGEISGKEPNLPCAENLNLSVITTTNDDNNNNSKENEIKSAMNDEIILNTGTSPIVVNDNVTSNSHEQSSPLRSNNISDSVECNINKISRSVNYLPNDHNSDSDDTTISATSIERINLLRHFPIVNLSPRIKIIERDDEIDCYDDCVSNSSIISVKSASNETPLTQDKKAGAKSFFRIKPTPVQILREIYEEDKRNKSDDSDIEIISPKHNDSLNYYSSIRDSRNQVVLRKTTQASASASGEIIECLIDSDSDDNVNKVTDYDGDKTTCNKNSLSPDSGDASNLNYKKRMITEFENENNNNPQNYSNDDSNDCLILSEKFISSDNHNEQSSFNDSNEIQKRKNLSPFDYEDSNSDKKRKIEYADISYNYYNLSKQSKINSDNSLLDAATTSSHKKNNVLSFGSMLGKSSTQQNLEQTSVPFVNADIKELTGSLNSEKQKTKSETADTSVINSQENSLIFPHFTKKLRSSLDESLELSSFIKKEYDVFIDDSDVNTFYRPHFLSFYHKKNEQELVSPEPLQNRSLITNEINISNGNCTDIGKPVSSLNGFKPKNHLSLLNTSYENFKKKSSSKNELKNHKSNNVPVNCDGLNNKPDHTNFMTSNRISVLFNENVITNVSFDLSPDQSELKCNARDPTAKHFNYSSYGYTTSYDNYATPGPSHQKDYFNDDFAVPSSSFEHNNSDQNNYLVNDDVDVPYELDGKARNHDHLIDNSLNYENVYNYNNKEEPGRPSQSSQINDADKVPSVISEPIALNDSFPNDYEQILTTPLSPVHCIEPDSPRPVCIVTETAESPPNFDEMEDNDIEKRLEKYGIKKSLSKKDARRLLKFLYERLHPLLPVNILDDKVSLKKVAQSFCDTTTKNGDLDKNSEDLNAEDNYNFLTKDVNLLADNDNVDDISSDETSSDSDIMEEMEVESEPDDVDEHYNKGNFGDAFKRYIRGNRELYNNILLYKVVQLEDIIGDLRFRGIKFRIKDLMEELDKQGIVYQSNHGYNLRKRKPPANGGVKPKMKKVVTRKLKAAATTAADALGPAQNGELPTAFKIKNNNISSTMTSSQVNDINNFENHIPNGQNGFIEFPGGAVSASETTTPSVLNDSSPDNKAWTCTICTVINKPLAVICEACETRNPNIKEEPSYEELIKLENQPAVLNRETFECKICLTDCEPGNGVILRDCLHHFCRECLALTVKNSDDVVVKCPYRDDNYVCQSKIQEREIKYIAPAEIVEQYHNKALALTENAMSNTFHCKTPDCKMWCILDDANDVQNVNIFNCMACGASNCIPCQAIHPQMNCLQYQIKLEMDSNTDPEAKKTFNCIKKMLETKKAMHCPKCNVIVMKSAGCDWIKCSMCHTEICWATLGPRWGPGGFGDTSGGCRCKLAQGQPCTPLCKNCH